MLEERSRACGGWLRSLENESRLSAGICEDVYTFGSAIACTPWRYGEALLGCMQHGTQLRIELYL